MVILRLYQSGFANYTQLTDLPITHAHGINLQYIIRYLWCKGLDDANTTKTTTECVNFTLHILFFSVNFVLLCAAECVISLIF